VELTTVAIDKGLSKELDRMAVKLSRVYGRRVSKKELIKEGVELLKERLRNEGIEV